MVESRSRGTRAPAPLCIVGTQVGIPRGSAPALGHDLGALQPWFRTPSAGSRDVFRILPGADSRALAPWAWCLALQKGGGS